MTTAGVSFLVGEGGRIPIFTGPENWPEFESNLEGQLRIHGWWRILIDEEAEPQESDFEKKSEYRKETKDWNLIQEKLLGVFQLYIDRDLRGRLEDYRQHKHTPSKNGLWNAISAYHVLKALLGVQGFIARRPISKVISQAKLNDYLLIKDYGNAIQEASSQLQELGEPLPDWFVSDRFIAGLGFSYNNWIDVQLAQYSANPVDEEGKMRYPTVKDMVASLLDRELVRSEGKSSHKALQTQSRSESRSNSKGRGQNNKDNCGACFGHHPKDDCWVRSEESWKTAPDWLKTKYSNWKEAQKDRRKVNQGQGGKRGNNKGNQAGQEGHSLLAQALKTTGVDNTWYCDNAASYHITHDRTLFPGNLNDASISVGSVTDSRLVGNGAGTARLPVRVGDSDIWINLYDVNYCPKAQCNLISIGFLEKKGCRCVIEKGRLSLFRPSGELTFQADRTSTNVYVLNQHYSPNMISSKQAAFKTTTKKITKALAHRRLGHMNNGDLDKLLKMSTGLKLDKNSPEPGFCEPCTKGKQHKTHSKEPPSHRVKEPGERWHANLVGGGQSLVSVGGAKYGIWLTCDATRYRVFRTIKSRD